MEKEKVFYKLLSDDELQHEPTAPQHPKTSSTPIFFHLEIRILSFIDNQHKKIHLNEKTRS